MPWAFSDGFDCYTASADMGAGYWDTANTQQSFPAGRFAGGRAVQIVGTGPNFVKASGANDSVHHINIAAYFLQAPGATTSVQNYIQLLDGTTPQCTIAFLNNGGIALLSGGTGGATLATYPAGMQVTTWYAFEIEVVVHNSTGSFKVRKSGNPVDDHSTTGIDTAGGTANNFANKIAFGLVNGSPAMYLDDFYWRSDLTSVPWWTEIRCQTRMPVADAGVQQFAVVGTRTIANTGGGGMVSAVNRVYYGSFTPTYGGVLSYITLWVIGTYVGNIKCALYTDNAGAPGTVIATATNVINNPAVGVNVVFNFAAGLAITLGQKIWVGFCTDAGTGGSVFTAPGSTGGFYGTTTYASFPVANPPSLTTGVGPIQSALVITPTNSSAVNEPQQDSATTYVYSSTPGQADFYSIAPIAATPLQTFAVTTRAFMTKSDVGTRTAAVQLRSGGVTVASPTLVLTVPNWAWAWRMDALDPATGLAWTPAAVNAAQPGPLVVA